MGGVDLAVGRSPQDSPTARGLPQSSPRSSPRTPGSARKLRRAVAKICWQKSVVEAFVPEPAWRQLRPYATLFSAGLVFSPVSQTILTTSVCATTTLPQAAWPVALQGFGGAARIAWWWPTVWWRGLYSVCRKAAKREGLCSFLKGSVIFALHDVVTRGRTQWVDQAVEVGAVRAQRPLLRSVLLEATAGIVGSRMSFEYIRCVVGGCGSCSWLVLCLGALAGCFRGVLLSSGGRSPRLQTACSWADFLIEVFAERESACLLGFACPVTSYVPAVLWGIGTFIPWGVLLVPCNRALTWIFGEDPIAKQKATLERVALELEHSQRGQAQLARARARVVSFTGEVELSSLWHKVRESSAQSLRRLASASLQMMMTTSSGKSLDAGDAAQRKLEILLMELAATRAEDIRELFADASEDCDELTELREQLKNAGSEESLLAAQRLQEGQEDAVARLLEQRVMPIVVRRQDMVRSALTQVAERSVAQLLLGISGRSDQRLESFISCLGLRVQFVGEEGLDMGGVRKDFIDCFALALTRTERGPFALVEPVRLLGLGADCTWRPIPCDEEHQSYLWALGRLLALALVYRCPCPIALSVLVFKCILGVPLRPGDVRQLDPDFWRHRVEPLLMPGGVEVRQAQLREWCMDPLTFVSADGSRQLIAGGDEVLVTDSNSKEYAQLLCEDFLIGSTRKEIGCLVLGFHEVVPRELLRGLDAEQLRMLVCGVAELDVDEWQAHAQIEGSKRVARWFFGWLRRQTQETRSKMLAFVTGSSVLPVGWSGLRDQEGKPLPFRILVQGDEESLPSAHTCSNLLVLPPVSSEAKLEAGLDRVIEFAGREMLLV